MSPRLPCILWLAIAAWVMGGHAVSAQQQPSQGRLSAGDVLNGQPITRSFEALEPLLEAGREVVITDEKGRRRRGRLVGISATTIVLAHPVAAGTWEAALPLYWPLDLGLVLKRHLAPSEARTFEEPSVTRIEIVDPATNGTLMGGVAGASLAAAAYLWERRQPPSSLKGLATALALVWGVPVSLRMGHVIDRSINDPIYERSPRSPRARIVPRLSSDSGEVVVALEW